MAMEHPLELARIEGKPIEEIISEHHHMEHDRELKGN